MTIDILVIGGGIQGVGVAQAAAAAGYSVSVVEKTDLAAGTSHCSSKLIHGGLRYLESAQFSLVRKSILERERLIKLAPGLIKPVPFYIPIYKNTSRHSWQIRIGLILYSLLGSFKQYARFSYMSPQQISTKLPQLNFESLKCVYQYYDAQTNDAELTKAVMRSAESLRAKLLCPAEYVGAVKTAEGYAAKIIYNGTEITLACRAIVNAGGPWVNQIVERNSELNLSTLDFDCVQGAHIELDASPPDGVIYVEAPQDKRAVFIMPWQGLTLVGTTEKIYDEKIENVHATEAEIDYLKTVYEYYFTNSKKLKTVNVINTFAGIRVLPKASSSMFNRPRDTVIHQAASGFVTLYGGKLTSYRATAQEVMSVLCKTLPKREPVADTRKLKLS